MATSCWQVWHKFWCSSSILRFLFSGFSSGCRIPPSVSCVPKRRMLRRVCLSQAHRRAVRTQQDQWCEINVTCHDWILILYWYFYHFKVRSQIVWTLKCLSSAQYIPESESACLETFVEGSGPGETETLKRERHAKRLEFQSRVLSKSVLRRVLRCHVQPLEGSNHQANWHWELMILMIL